MIKQIIVSDSGPISDFKNYMHPRNQALTSLIYLGKYLFFFGKNYIDNGFKFILNEINFLEKTQAENENFQIRSQVHDENISIHFAQEGE